MGIIYVDILLLENFYVNYLLLRAAAKLTHSPLRTIRAFCGAGVGSLFALLILLPPLPVWLQIACKLLAAGITVRLAFSWERGRFLSQCGWFFCASFCLAGILLAVSEVDSSGFSAWGNSYCYLQLSLVWLVLCTALAYFLLWLLRRVRGRRQGDAYQLYIRYQGNTCALPGLMDTGNRLIDPFSGRPVIVCAEDKLQTLWGEAPIESLAGYRLVPCATVMGDGLMSLFRPDEICLRTLPNGTAKRIDAMIGLGGAGDYAIFHPELLG